MTADHVILRIRGSGMPPDCGEILEKVANGYRVRWQNGTEAVVQIGNVVTRVERGSLRFERLTDPEGLRERFAAGSVNLVVRILRESGSSMSAKKIKDTLLALNIDKADIDTAWPTVRKALDKHPHVLRLPKPPGYRWTDEPVDPLATVRATRPVDALNRVVRSSVPAAEREVLAEIVRVAAERDAVLAMLAGAAGIQASPREPWPGAFAGAKALTQFDEAVIEVAVKRTDHAFTPVQLAAILATPRRQGADWSLGPPSSDELHTALAAASDEVEQSSLDVDTQRLAATFVARLVGDEYSARLEFDDVVRLFRAVVHKLGRDASSAIEDLVGWIAGHLSESPGEDEQLIEELRLGAVRLPLSPEGARTRLVVAAHRRAPELLSNRDWWRGVTIDQLVAASGVLGPVLIDPAIAEAAIKPVLEPAIRDAVDRRALARLIAMPPVIARMITAPSVRAAWRRVAGDDPLAAQWLEGLSDDEQRAELQEAVRSAERALGAVGRRADEAEATVARLREQVVTLDEQIRGHHQAAATLHESQRRQARVDVLRTLAELAVEAHMIANESGDTSWLRTIERLVSPHGLERIGFPGEPADYNPKQHELASGRSDAGDRVLVIRPGYLVREPDAANVLLKALVRQQ